MGSSCDNDQLVDTIEHIVHVSAALAHVCYALSSKSERNSQMFVRWRRRCVSNIFQSLAQLIQDEHTEWMVILSGNSIIH